MKRTEVFLNIIHYFFYRFHYKLHMGFNKINPFMLIHKLPFQKKRYKKLGINIYEKIDEAFANKNNGLSVAVSGGAIFGLLFFLFMAFGLFYMKIFRGNEELILWHFAVFSLISLGLCYFFIFKDDKYLKYFKKFENWAYKKKQRYMWMTWGFVVFVFFLLAINFI